MMMMNDDRLQCLCTIETIRAEESPDGMLSSLTVALLIATTALAIAALRTLAQIRRKIAERSRHYLKPVKKQKGNRARSKTATPVNPENALTDE